MYQQARGSQTMGRLIEAQSSSLQFLPDGEDKPVVVQVGETLRFEKESASQALGYPPFQVDLGLGRRLSGRLISLDPKVVRLKAASVKEPLRIEQGGVTAIVQRQGEMRVLAEDFDTSTLTGWVRQGPIEVVNEPRSEGTGSLRIGAGGATLARKLAEPIALGRLELVYSEQGSVEPGEQSYLELVFNSKEGPRSIRAILGWSEESLSVESPAGPALAIQRLVRKPGWHRLSVRFDQDRTEFAVDGDQLAHGRGPGGPLVEIRLGTRTLEGAKSTAHPSLNVDDLSLTRFAALESGLEVDPQQDEVRLAGGDQVFGSLQTADENRIVFVVDQREIPFAWTEVTGLQLKRSGGQSKMIGGTWVRLDWASSPDEDSEGLDRVDGALVAVEPGGITLNVPFVGTFTVRREDVRRIKVLGQGQRVVVDAKSHHLGNDIVSSPVPLDPPQPEGRLLERTVELSEATSGPALLQLDVLLVEGEASGLPFFDSYLKKGEIQTRVAINGQSFDHLNRHISSKNETPERIALSIPAGLLHAGTNSIRIEQFGTKTDPNFLDDLGILEMAIEIPQQTSRSPGP